MIKTSIFLVGPMGAGKSTIGRLLSKALDVEFKDSDREIEARTGADIPWIFDVEGEEGFRDRESAMLEELTQQNGMILATGGGAVLREKNRRMLLQSTGTVIYLYTSVEQQLARTFRDKRRPLLQNENPQAVLAKLMKIRDPLYREVSDYIITTDNKIPRTVVNEICRVIQQ
ncbi:shikimate kinase AroK [Zooshikella sp. RANM57]|uniref:shikimate kinase AroK n=1 Tax=Zooshikella sp. RANM57 TaxID=3425863 RepID=UPI003D6DACEE